MDDGDDLEAARTRADALARDNAELRARVEVLQAAAPGSGDSALVGRELQRRRRVAGVLLAGGGVAIVAGIFAGSLVIAALGVGWLFGGGAVASTLPASEK